MPKISERTIINLICIGVMIMIGCSYRIGPATNNNDIAVRIYKGAISADAQITKDRKEVFRGLQEIIKKMAPGKAPVNYVFNSLLGLNKLQVEFVKKAVRRHVERPKVATDPKVILVKDFQDIVERILHLYEYDSLGNIIPTWRKKTR